MQVISKIVDENGTKAEHYSVDAVLECSGEGAWVERAGHKVHVTGVRKVEYTDEDGDDIPALVYVKHDSDWQIYGDVGFLDAICKLTGWELDWTEQGMQEDKQASLEVIQ